MLQFWQLLVQQKVPSSFFSFFFFELLSFFFLFFTEQKTFLFLFFSILVASNLGTEEAFLVLENQTACLEVTGTPDWFGDPCCNPYLSVFFSFSFYSLLLSYLLSKFFHSFCYFYIYVYFS